MSTGSTQANRLAYMLKAGDPVATEEIRAALRETDGDVAAAALRLRVGRSTLFRWLQEYHSLTEFRKNR